MPALRELLSLARCVQRSPLPAPVHQGLARAAYALLLVSSALRSTCPESLCFWSCEFSRSLVLLHPLLLFLQALRRLVEFVLLAIYFALTQDVDDVVLHGWKDALEHGVNVFADYEVAAKVEALGRRLQLRAGRTEESVALVQVPLCAPIQERGTRAFDLDIKVFRLLRLLNLGDVKLHAHVVTSRIGVFLLTLDIIVKK